MVIEAFDKTLYATIEDSIFSLEEIPEVQLKSENFDEILPAEPKKIYIPRMIHPWKRKSFELFTEKQSLKISKELEKLLKYPDQKIKCWHSMLFYMLCQQLNNCTC